MNYLFKNTVLVLLVVVSSTNNLFAQKNQDFSGWVSAGVNLKVTKKITVDFNQNIRFKDNISTIDDYFSQFGAEYEVYKKIKIGAGFRIINEIDDKGKIQGIEKHFRYQYFVKYKHDLIKRLDLMYRLQYQNKNELDVIDNPSEAIRFLVGLDYKIKPIKANFIVQGEAFYNLNAAENEKYINQYRLNLKLVKEILRNNEIEVFYRIQKNTNTFDIKNIIGLNYTYNLDLTE